jgi:hypothetical protein
MIAGATLRIVRSIRIFTAGTRAVGLSTSPKLSVKFEPRAPCARTTEVPREAINKHVRFNKAFEQKD